MQQAEVPVVGIHTHVTSCNFSVLFLSNIVISTGLIENICSLAYLKGSYLKRGCQIIIQPIWNILWFHIQLLHNVYSRRWCLNFGSLSCNCQQQWCTQNHLYSPYSSAMFSEFPTIEFSLWVLQLHCQNACLPLLFLQSAISQPHLSEGQQGSGTLVLGAYIRHTRDELQAGLSQGAQLQWGFCTETVDTQWKETNCFVTDWKKRNMLGAEFIRQVSPVGRLGFMREGMAWK